MDMDARYMVKKWVCEFPGRFCKFRVFETGVQGWLLFCVLDPNGCDRSIHIPVKKTRLSNWARRYINAQYRRR